MFRKRSVTPQQHHIKISVIGRDDKDSEAVRVFKLLEGGRQTNRLYTRDPAKLKFCKFIRPQFDEAIVLTRGTKPSQHPHITIACPETVEDIKLFDAKISIHPQLSKQIMFAVAEDNQALEENVLDYIEKHYPDNEHVRLIPIAGEHKEFLATVIGHYQHPSPQQSMLKRMYAARIGEATGLLPDLSMLTTNYLRRVELKSETSTDAKADQKLQPKK